MNDAERPRIMEMLPSKEDLDRMVEAGARARRERCLRGGQVNGFTPVDLGSWIALCQRARVPYVPAVPVASVSTIDVWEYSDPEDLRRPPESFIKFWSDVREAQEWLGDGWMMRWSCCSLAEVKMRLSDGEAQWRKEFLDLRVDDFRAFDIIADFPLPEITAWARPWIDIAKEGSHPIEYRVFVQDNNIVGISNYYPQRSLPCTASTLADIEACRTWTQRLIRAQDKSLNCPEIDGFLPLDRNHFTADFVRLPSGAVIFLEGGPPHTARWGAHPCCFVGGEVCGVALECRDPEHLRGE